MALVVSLLADRFATLARRAIEQAPGADLVEIRLDRIGHPGEAALATLFVDCPVPVIVAVNGPEAFGTWEGGEEARLAILRDAAAAGAGFVDVDWRLADALGAVPGPCRRIVSRHVVDGTPAEIAPLHEELSGVLREGDVPKLVTHARCAEDGMRVLRWLGGVEGVVGFSSGEAGRFTRVLALLFGSPFTYCAPAPRRGEEPLETTAPGQVSVDELRAMLPREGVAPATAVLGVVGNPIGHSLSPRVHGVALRAAGIDAVYVAFQPEDLDAFLDLADDERFRGFSVTIPFKERAFARAETCDAGSRRTGASNTLVRTATGWSAHNTDVTAVGSVLDEALVLHRERTGRSLDPAGLRVLLLGSGGAGRAAAGAVLARGGLVTVTGIPEDQAFALGEELGCVAVEWSRIPEIDYDVLIHATPVGMFPDVGRCVVPEEWIRPDRVVIDAVYVPARTALLAAAEARGCTCLRGGLWFVGQAVEQFRLFTGREPDEALMRRAFEEGVGIDG